MRATATDCGMTAGQSNPLSAVRNPRSASWVDATAVGAIAFAIRAGLIIAYPFVYGGDPIIRLIESDRILISYQLPGLQAIIYLIHALGGGVLASRLAVAALSALAAAGLCCLVATRWSRAVAILAGLILACNPYVVTFSTVPYQFPLVLAAVHWGLFFFMCEGGRLRWLGCSICFAVACLTRYEAWIFAACVGVAWIWIRVTGNRAGAAGTAGPLTSASSHNIKMGVPFFSLRLMRTIVAGLLLFGWAPIIWFAFNRGFNPTGTFVIGGIEEWRQLLRPLTTVTMLLGLSGPLIVAVAIIGLSTLWRKSRSTAPGWATFAGVWIVASAIGLIFSAHPVQPPSARLAAFFTSVGIDPTPAMFVTSREGHLYISLLSILGALGIARIGQFRLEPPAEPGALGPGLWDQESEIAGRRRMWRGAAMVLVTACLLGHSTWIGAARIARISDDDDLQAAVGAARTVDALLGSGGRIIVLARPIPPQDIQNYLDRARRAGGMAGLRRAKSILASIETGPWSYQRMLVHSRHDRKRLLKTDDIERRGDTVEQVLHSMDVRYCVIFNDFVARRDVDRVVEKLARAGGVVSTVNAGRGAVIYAIDKRAP